SANANLGYRRQFDQNNALLNIGASQDYNLTQNLLKRDLPSITFSASGPLVPPAEDEAPVVGDDPWYQSWTWNYANNFNVHQQSIPTAEARRGDTTTFMGYSDRLTLSGKYTALKYINLTPSVNLSQLWSATERTGDSLNPTRNAFAPTGGSYGHYFAAWNANVKAETRLFGLAQAADDPWFGRITAARHTIT